MEDKKEKVFILYQSYKENIFSSEVDDWEICEVFALQEHLDAYLDKYDITLNQRDKQGWKYRAESYTLFKEDNV